MIFYGLNSRSALIHRADKEVWLMLLKDIPQFNHLRNGDGHRVNDKQCLEIAKAIKKQDLSSLDAIEKERDKLTLFLRKCGGFEVW